MIIIVTWRPFTLVEARGFIEYIVQMFQINSLKRQAVLVREVPMDQSSATLNTQDTLATYEVSVATRSVANDAVGPGQELE